MADAAPVLKLVTLAGGVVCVLAALALRARESWPARHPALAGVLLLLPAVTGVAGHLWLFVSLLPVLPRQPIVAGAFFGLMVFAMPIAMGASVIAFLALVDRSALPTIEDPALLVRTSLAAALGCVVAGMLLLQTLSLMRRSVALAILLVPLLVALFPLVRQLLWAPALLAGLRRRQRQLEPACAADLRAWAGGIAATYRLGKLDVLFGPAKVANAAAVGFPPLTRFIMIGDGLTRAMPAHELRAILAHEIAHVLRGDVRNQLLLWIGLTSLWVYVSSAIRIAMDVRGPFWAMAGGAGSLAVVAVAGRYSRYCELAADRLAAELTEDPAAMRDALSRLADVTKMPAHRRSPTHPSLKDRLDALPVPAQASAPLVR